MRFSEVLNSLYGIVVRKSDADILDTHFTASAHHWYRRQECLDSIWDSFHLVRHLAHLRAMMEVVYVRGDFSKSFDGDGLKLDIRENWDPDNCRMPDPEMFGAMYPNPFYEVGFSHPSDVYVFGIFQHDDQNTNDQPLRHFTARSSVSH